MRFLLLRTLICRRDNYARHARGAEYRRYLRGAHKSLGDEKKRRQAGAVSIAIQAPRNDERSERLANVTRSFAVDDNLPGIVLVDAGIASYQLRSSHEIYAPSDI